MNLSIQTKAFKDNQKANSVDAKPVALKRVKAKTAKVSAINPQREYIALQNTNSQLINKIKELNSFWKQEQSTRNEIEIELNEYKLTSQQNNAKFESLVKNNAKLKVLAEALSQKNESISVENDLLNSKVLVLDETITAVSEKEKQSRVASLALRKELDQSEKLFLKARNKIKVLNEQNKQLHLDQQKMLDAFTKQLDALTSHSSKELVALAEKPTSKKGNVAKQIQQKLESITKNVTNNMAKKVRHFNEKLEQLKAQKADDQQPMSQKLPHVSWTKLANCHPIKAGLYYVSNGSEVGVAMYNAKTHEFVLTKNNIAIDFWCLVEENLA